MKKKISFGLIILLIFIAFTGIFLFSKKTNPNKKNDKNLSSDSILTLKTMKLTSPVFENRSYLPSKYTCDGENVNPPLEISAIPEQTKSLVLIVDDPDAPGGTWVHWTLWNLAPKLISIRENSVPQEAIQGITSFGNIGWGGPCPPSGTHRYRFKLYALDILTHQNPKTTAKDLEKVMQGHILDSAELIGLYQKQ